MRFFNTAGPVDSADHYCLPPLARLNTPELLDLIGQKKYFILHAPRQTGKTSALLALQAQLNAEGVYRCVYVNVEMAQSAREDVRRGMRAILGEIAAQAQLVLGDDRPVGCWREILAQRGEDSALNELLTYWSAAE